MNRGLLLYTVHQYPGTIPRPAKISIRVSNSADGFKLIDKIRESFPEESLPEQFADKSLQLHFGLVEWQKGNDARLLMERAAEAMAHLKDQLEPAS